MNRKPVTFRSIINHFSQLTAYTAAFTATGTLAGEAPAAPKATTYKPYDWPRVSAVDKKPAFVV